MSRFYKTMVLIKVSSGIINVKMKNTRRAFTLGTNLRDFTSLSLHSSSSNTHCQMIIKTKGMFSDLLLQQLEL